jgi:hypothetical protein
VVGSARATSAKQKLNAVSASIVSLIHKLATGANMVGATRFIRRIANAAGFDIHRYSGAEWRWSYNVDSYYPVDPLPRWGYGKPPHTQINKTLDQCRADISARLSQFRKIDKVIN